MTSLEHCPPHARATHSDGHACALCGQPTTARRIDWLFIGDEVRRGLLSLEHGLLRTLLCLIFRPDRLLRDYLAGRRTAYVKPLWLLLSTAAVVTVLDRYAPGSGAITGFSGDMQASASTSDVAATLIRTYQSMTSWVSAHLALATVLVLPVEAAFLQLAFWRVRGLNYPEWLTITAYLTAQTFLFWSIGTALRGVVPLAEVWAMSIALLYMVVSLARTFDHLAWWNSALRGFAGLSAYMVATMLMFAALVLAIVRFSTTA